MKDKNFSPAPNGLKTSVAIVEDNKVVRDHVTKYINLSAYAEVVLVADSAESYLEQIQAKYATKADILLLDIGLPGMSGLEAIPTILEKQPGIDIIILTTFEEERLVVKALCLGAVAYLSKRSSLEEIIAAIRIVRQGGSYMSPMIAREISNYFVKEQTARTPGLLSKRHLQMLERLAEGKSYSEIANELFISVETVRSHIKKLYKVLHVNNKAEAIALYLRGEIN